LDGNGENVGNYAEPDATGNHWIVDSYQEMEYKLHSLRSLVCDLLKTNQELRDALLNAKIDVPLHQGT
jgi:hypothetical protein